MAANTAGSTCCSPARSTTARDRLCFFPSSTAPATNYGITRNTDYENFQHILATISFHGFTLQGLFSARDKGVPTAYFGAVFNDPRTRNLDYHQYFDLSYQHSIGEKWELTARTSYDQARLQAPLALSTGLPDGSTTVDTYLLPGKLVGQRSEIEPELCSKNTKSPWARRSRTTCGKTRGTTLPSATSLIPTPQAQ